MGVGGIHNLHRSLGDYGGILQGEFPRENQGIPQKKLLSRLFIIITMGGVVLIENIDELNPDCLNDVYKDFANYLGMEMALKLYQHYKGLQITFPQRFLSRDYVRKQVLVEHDGTNSKELARKYGYTERVIRDWLTETKSTG